MRGRIWRALCSVLCGCLAILIGTGVPYFPPPLAQAQPADAQLTKKLVEEGITAYQAGRYDEAVGKLTQARTLLPAHSPIALYLGLAYLQQQKNAEAIAAWQEYIKLQPYTEAERQANLPQTIPGYLTLLLREENRRIAREAIAREQKLGPGDPQTVAITNYRNLGSPQLGVLQKGLTALLISDISKVKDLKVVERDLLQALLEEMQLGTSGVLDEKTAPKAGRLLGAGKVATGSYVDATQDNLQATSVLAESTTAQVVGTQESSGTLQQFYELEKGIALGLLRDLGYDEQRLRNEGVWDSIRQPQTTSVVALTAFSRGLDAKDRADYPAARAQFDQALAADPNFQEAEEERRKLPLAFLPSGGIAAAVGGVAPTAAAATAGIVPAAAVAGVAAGAAAGTGLGISGTALAIGAGVAAVGAGVGGGIAASSGGGGGGGGSGGGSGRCGNSQINSPREQCDDGNAAGGDCCSADCQVEDLGSQTCGVGACQRTVPRCDAAGQPQTCTDDTPGTETCNGVDDDCNGTIDDNLTDEGQPCTTDQPGACGTGTFACTGGSLRCTPTQASPEICDGQDNDCNGAVDDGVSGGGACTVGMGACERMGTLTCVNGQASQCNATAGTPTREVCNRIDDDCDGTSDDGLNQTETCG
ncbi:MAG: MopE-related protein, partial [Candidatus Binatia bacterium]